MNKPILLFRGPVKSVSGYGAHSRDLLKCLYDLDLFNIKIDSSLWGVTPLDALEKDNEFHNWIMKNIITSIDDRPDYYFHVTVPNEFIPLGKFNIGVTAGVETTMAPKDWIDGCNKMNLVITTSNFSKEVLVNTIYSEKDKFTNQTIKVHRIKKPVEVLFEGVDVDVYNNVYNGIDLDINEDFCFLFVGHWLKGALGQDRKDVGMLIKCFLEAFKDDEKKPALILKTTTSTFSVKERENIRKRIEDLSSGIDNPPPIYLLFGNLTNKEMNELYNHPNIKAMISLTKGEGFGRPLLEFSLTGKPIITSNWSGHKDFLSMDKAILLGGELQNVHESVIDNFIIKDAKWFTANYNEAIYWMKVLKNNYGEAKIKSESLRLENMDKFSFQNMKNSLYSILLPYINEPQERKIKLPELIKIG